MNYTPQASRTSARCLLSALRSASPNHIATVRACCCWAKGLERKGPFHLARFDEPPCLPDSCRCHAQAS